MDQSSEVDDNEWKGEKRKKNFVCLSGWNFVINFKQTSSTSQRLEICTIAKKWMTMNENVKKEEKNPKKRRLFSLL